MNKRQIKGDYKMGKNYEMVTLKAYIENLEDKNKEYIKNALWLYHY